jgi:hypothetical protein
MAITLPYSETKPIKFNPFYIGGGDVLDTEKERKYQNIITCFMEKDDETFNRSEYT